MIRFLLITSLFSLASLSLAQTGADKVFVKGEYFNTPLITFIREIQAKHDVQFHYVNEIIDTVRVSGIIRNNTSLNDALKMLLRDKPISFAWYDGQVTLYKNDKKEITEGLKFFSLSGIVADKRSGQPLPFVSVQMPGFSKGSVTDEEGRFEITPVPEGTHLVQFSFVGYHPVTRKVTLEANTLIQVNLEEKVMELKELVITPSTFEISTIETTPHTLGKAEILHSPNMGKDIYRTLRVLPGIANNDFSSKARIRGGHSSETAVYLDHFLINDAFHLDELDGSFSIFNTDYVDELTVLTGGFSAKYTDRLSGIIDMKTFDHIEADQYKFSIDLMNMSLFMQKKISDKTNVSLTGRRGYLDFLLQNMGTDDTDVIDPRFSDFWSKITHKINDHNSLSFNVLVGRDNFLIADSDEAISDLHIKNVRDNVNTWINWKWFPSSKFNSVSTLGYQVLDEDANFVFADNAALNNTDQNQTNALIFTNNSYIDLSASHRFEIGVEWKKFVSRYQYKEMRYDVFNSTPDNVIIYDIDIDQKLKGHNSAAYLQYSWTIRKNLIIQPGMRAVWQSYSPELKMAPRFAMHYSISPSFNLKLAYGHYYQPDLYFSMRTPIFQQELYDKNSKSIHYTGAVTYHHNRTNVMLNVYHKEYDYLFDDYRFEFFNRLGGISILDIPFNTRSGYSQGVEIMVRQAYGQRNSMLSLSYAYARSRIRNDSGQETYRDFDQPHAIIVNNTFRLPLNWNISLLWNFHTGYPYTPTTVDFIQYQGDTDFVLPFYETGMKNSERLPNHHTLDIRIEKSWQIGKNVLCAYLNIVNFYNRENIRSYWWYPIRQRNGSIYFEPEDQTGIPFFVSPGISFTLY